jgi:hypothetical protein
MTISTLLMILAFAVGPETSQSIGSDSMTSLSTIRPPARIENNCWINGVWYNPCPSDLPTDPLPFPKVQPVN